MDISRTLDRRGCKEFGAHQIFDFEFLADALDIIHDDMYYYCFMMGLARCSAKPL